MDAATFLQTLGMQAWQLALLVLLVACGVRLLARNRPHLAYALWFVVLLKCVTPPVWVSPVGVFSWIAAAPWSVASGDAASPAMVDERLSVDQGIGTATTPIVIGSGTIPDRGVMAPLEAAAEDRVDLLALDPTVSGQWLAQVAIAIWLVGGGCIALLLAARLARCYWQLRRSPTESYPEVERLLISLQRQLRLRRRVRLWITASRVGPAVIGLWRPTILLPACVVRGRSAEELAPILAHELLHVRRGDLWVGLLQSVTQALWWFHPLVWLAGGRITREAERCCDEEVIGELGCDPARYARSLLTVLELKRTLIPVPAVPGVRAVEITSQRLERIMTLRQGCHRRTPWWCWVVLLVVAAFALPGSPLSKAVADPPAESASAKDAPLGDPSAVPPSPLTPAKPPQGYSNPAEALKAAEASAAKGESQFPPEREGDLGDLEAAPDRETSVPYRVEKLLTEIRDRLDIDRSAAKQVLWSRMVTAQRSLAELPSYGADLRSAVGSPVSLVPPSAFWLADVLVIKQSSKEHQRTAALLEEFAELGFEMCEVEIRFVTAPLDHFTNISKNWTTLPRPSGNSVLGERKVQPSKVGHDFAMLEVEKNVPLIIDVLDDVRRKELFEEMDGDRRAHLLRCPRVRLFNGQSATVMEGMQQPFVVGMKEGKPWFSVIPEGTQVQVRAVLSKGQAKLDLAFVLTAICGVEDAKVVNSDGSETTVKNPEVTKLSVASTFDVPLGQSLLIGGFRHPSNKVDKMAFGLLVRVTPFLAKAEHAKQSAVGARAVPHNRQQTSAAAPTNNPSETSSPTATSRQAAEIGKGVNGQATLEGRVVLDASPEEEDSLVTRVYDVGDLVRQAVEGQEPAGSKSLSVSQWMGRKTPESEIRSLIELMTDTIAPSSWEKQGGKCRIGRLNDEWSLVVTQTSSGHGQVGKLLEQLRRNLDLQVSLVIRPIKASPGLLPSLAVDQKALADNRAVPVTDRLRTEIAGIVYTIDRGRMQALDVQKNAQELGHEKGKRPEIVLRAKSLRFFLHNQHATPVPLAGEQADSFLIQPVIMRDRRTVRLTIQGPLLTDGKAKTASFSTLDCESLLLDASRFLDPGASPTAESNLVLVTAEIVDRKVARSSSEAFHD